jgi:tetratricopeptide (TPR) repeat protein
LWRIIRMRVDILRKECINKIRKNIQRTTKGGDMKKFFLFVFLVIFLAAGFNGCSSAEKTGGNIHLQEGRYDRAIGQYRKALEKYPNDSDLYVAIGAAQFMKKNFKEAVNNLEKAESMNPEGIDEDINQYEELLNTKYLKWQIYYNGAVEYSEENPDKAVDLAKKSLDVGDPKKVSQSYNLLANMMLNMDKVEEAKSFLSKAIEADKDNIEAYMTMGHYYLSAREPDNALKYFNEVVKIDSTKIQVYELIGQAYLLKDNHDEAIKSLKKAFSISKNDPTILYNLMLANYRAKNYDEAINRGKEILELKNVAPSVLTGTYNLMGQMYNDKKEYKNAIAIIKEAIEKGANNCDSYSLAAFASYKLGNVKESTDWSNKMEECEKNQ